MKARLVDFWRRLRWTRPRIDRVVFYPSRADAPEEIPRHTIAVIGSEKLPKWAILECPCGRGHQLAISLSEQHRPFWRLAAHSANNPSLSPSIDSQSPYRCHFWLSDGRVHWAPSGRSN